MSEKLLFEQRFNFYFKNGVTKSELKNKSVIELCPGTGYNAYYLLKKCKIKKIIVETSKFNPDKKINSKNFNVIFTNILKINKILKKAKPKNKISLALNEFIKLMSKFKKNKKINLKTKYFYKFWGIGTQHINLYKTAD